MQSTDRVDSGVFQSPGTAGKDVAADVHDLEAHSSGSTDNEPRTHLHREFKERHVSMIAVAGAIGTGLIIGSGTGLVRGGPASILIAHCIMGTVVYFVMTALGEMATMLPMEKGFSGYATRFVDPALGCVFSFSPGISIVPCAISFAPSSWDLKLSCFLSRKVRHRLELLLQICNCPPQ
jgi:amino acid permease